MGRCNYCKWQDLKRAGHRKATAAERRTLWDAEVERESEGEQQLVDRFGAGVVIVAPDGTFSCWFMALPGRCAC